MTAEVAIANRSAVALAADSALTVRRNDPLRRDRVWNNANKLFELSSCNDIGVMIFNTGDFCGVSWEIVLKRYRKSIGDTRFFKLDDAVSSFTKFLGAFETPDPELDMLNVFIIFLHAIAECKSAVGDGGKVQQRNRFIAHADLLISEIADDIVILENLTRESFSKTHSKAIKRFLLSEADVHVTKAVHSKMITLCHERTRRNCLSSFETGVVFAGYGDAELFPVIQEITVDGRHGPDVRLWVESQVNLNDKGAPSALVKPFAQSDIAYLFMEGMQLDYLEFLDQTIIGLLDEKSKRLIDDYVPQADRLVETAKQSLDNGILAKNLFGEFQKMRREEAINPMLDVVATLPKEEMAAMAEALVEITSLRRKIDSDTASVGGPVDVAIISKADGFVWIKRKHYFDMDLNKDFMVRRQGRFRKEIDNGEANQ